MNPPPGPPPPKKDNTVLVVLVIVGAVGLVVCLVAGVVAALVLPAVARARERAMTMQCRARLSQAYMRMINVSTTLGSPPGSLPVPGGTLSDGTSVPAGPAWWSLGDRSAAASEWLCCPLTGHPTGALDYAGPAPGVDPNRFGPSALLGRDRMGNHPSGYPLCGIRVTGESVEMDPSDLADPAWGNAWGNANLSD